MWHNHNSYMLIINLIPTHTFNMSKAFQLTLSCSTSVDIYENRMQLISKANSNHNLLHIQNRFLFITISTLERFGAKTINLLWLKIFASYFIRNVYKQQSSDKIYCHKIGIYKQQEFFFFSLCQSNKIFCF